MNGLYKPQNENILWCIINRITNMSICDDKREKGKRKTKYLFSAYENIQEISKFYIVCQGLYQNSEMLQCTKVERK